MERSTLFAIREGKFYGGAKWHIGSDTLIANVLIDNGWNIGYPLCLWTWV
jgi:hypothetical protein